jgi:hypothetical protein
MPTIKPRVNVTLEPQTHAVIERLAHLQGRTRGAVIADLLDSIAPVMGRTVALLEAASSAPQQVKDGLRSVVEGVHNELLEKAGVSNTQMDMLLERLSGGSQGGVNPHVVTRGSGISPHAEEAQVKQPHRPRKPRGSTK